MDETFLALQRALAGEYSLEREIGRGGMGIVFLAREVQLDRLVAIKALPLTLTARDDVRERFIREARTAAALSHPNIVPIHRVGEAEGIPYFVMTFVQGETLGERLRSRGPVAPTALSRILHDVALALGYAHSRQVIHRDVKPDNILIEEASGRALVTDFGIARASADVDDAAVMGTVHFMSPEQARGETLDGRSDIYSLGVVAHLAATGHLPGESSSAHGLSGGGLARVVERCLRLEPSERFRSGEEVASALEAAAAPARRTVPALIREWTSAPAPLLNVYGFWSAGWLIASINQYVEWTNRGPLRSHGLENAFVGLALASAPLALITVFQLRKTYRALAAGYALDDLRAALSDWTVARKESLENERESNALQILRGLTWFFAVFATGAIIGLEAMNPYRVLPNGVRVTVLASIAAGIGSLAILSALGTPLFSPKLEAKFAGKLRSWLWNSRFGKWVADRLTPARRGVPDTAFRPTELALKLAVEDLYAALPQPYRQMIGELPPVASRLSEHVNELREEVERLELLRRGATVEEERMVGEMLTESRRQLGQTVGALERMRLELLRLHGGANDLQPMTTSMDAARAMVEEIVRLREAEGEVGPGRKRLPIDFRTPSPA